MPARGREAGLVRILAIGSGAGPGTYDCALKIAEQHDWIFASAGNVSFPKAENIREAAKQVPLDRMLIENDSPYLAPAPHRGKRNEPGFVVNTAEIIGQLRGMSKEEIGQRTA